ncbi:MarR family winged helix-turn-helix transcriptional regulator [Gordonia humi]|uniref:DNA-binding MarR family transcriptional regulator n=1 Tax=Gordonia humi TaxID=686429 RepID=A0A840F157_9ACTN|nr:MarR family transcriptional regulator [Gordonia humi]MBB4134080.1 DNA-binding MarR family transcriptional regulator [Gordonia humi]
MTDESLDPNRVWERLVHIVMDSRGNWQRRVVDAFGMSFTRVRVLRRLATAGELTMSELAHDLEIDGPATTVVVNALEDQGLVARRAHETNGRVKLVSLTDSGRDLLARARRIELPAPDDFRDLDQADLAALMRVLDRLG